MDASAPGRTRCFQQSLKPRPVARSMRLKNDADLDVAEELLVL